MRTESSNRWWHALRRIILLEIPFTCKMAAVVCSWHAPPPTLSPPFPSFPLPPFLLSPKRPCPFQDENGDAARSVATPVLSVPTVYHHHTPITPAVLFATKRVAVVVRGTKVGARWNTLPAISPHLFAGSLENKRSRISRWILIRPQRRIGPRLSSCSSPDSLPRSRKARLSVSIARRINSFSSRSIITNNPRILKFSKYLCVYLFEKYWKIILEILNICL